MEWIWVDGRQQDAVPADDRGLNLADGAFETLRVEAGRFCLLEQHRTRLDRSLHALLFDNAQAVAETALQSAQDLIRDVPGPATGALRVTVTRGSGPRGYRVPAVPQPRIIVRFNDQLPADPSPAHLWISGIRWGHQPYFAGCKILARTEQVVATAEAQRQQCDEALMLDQAGHWCSTASGNCFLRLDDRLLTPPLTTAGIAGTRRQAILEHWAAVCGYRCAETPITADIAAAATEAFYCNSLMGVRTIASVRDGEQEWRYPENDAALALASVVHSPFSQVGVPE